MPASCQARRTMASWPATAGLISEPLLRPSLVTALPGSRASTGYPARSASSSRARTTTPTPSLRTKPFAPVSPNLQRPSGESMAAWEKAMASIGDRMMLTPPAMARSVSPASRLWRAMWTATRDEEQAVSTIMLGPRRSRS
ncbi:hypothetical protein O1L60_00150 [Streptomyces diastatochromogenes]|nr:hypothetical protein [Streptomyces diastatochromogenes]